MKTFITTFFVFLASLIQAQDLSEIENYSFEETLTYIEQVSNRYIATPFLELSQGKAEAGTVSCSYSLEVSETGLFQAIRTCVMEGTDDKKLIWKAPLKRLELAELECKDYDVGKSLNYIFLNCRIENDYCFTKTKHGGNSVNTQGMAFYVTTRDAAVKLQKAFKHLLSLAYNKSSFEK